MPHGDMDGGPRHQAIVYLPVTRQTIPHALGPNLTLAYVPGVCVSLCVWGNCECPPAARAVDPVCQPLLLSGDDDPIEGPHRKQDEGPLLPMGSAGSWADQ